MNFWVKKTLARSGLDEEETSSTKKSLPSLSGRASELKTMIPAMSCDQESGNALKSRNEVVDELTDLPRGGMVSFQACSTSKSSLRSAYSRSLSVDSTQNYQESYFKAQRHRQHVGLNEHMFTPCSSPSVRTVRPLLVTDGKRIISRGSSDSYSGESNLQQDNCFYMKDIALGWMIPALQVTDTIKGKLDQKGGKGQCRRLSSSKTQVIGKQFGSQGSLDGAFLLCLGINVGVMSAYITNQREVDILNGRLKQKENLVQDLQEELEMKDSLTVKELANEDYDSQETSDPFFSNQVPTSFSSEQELESFYNDSKRIDYPKPMENSESMSQIEAELQAELEQLELDINASSLSTRYSEFAELDPNSVGIVVQGELRADMVKHSACFEADADRDASGTSTTQTENVNNAVSPRELRLRIVEVMEARLVSQVERIVELESELKDSHEKVEKMESELRNLQRETRDLSYSETGSLIRKCQTATEEGSTVTQPLFLNLTEDALDAYNECYDEFMRISGTDEEASPVAEEGFQNLSSVQNGAEENGSVPHYKMLEEEREPSTVLCDRNRSWGRFSGSRGSSEVGEFGDENVKENEDSDDDELLIKQILEKTKQGSPLVFNVQRMLLSMDENL